MINFLIYILIFLLSYFIITLNKKFFKKKKLKNSNIQVNTFSFKKKLKNVNIQVDMKPLTRRRRKSKEEVVREILEHELISSCCNYINCLETIDLHYKFGGYFCMEHLQIISEIRLELYNSKEYSDNKNELKFRIKEVLVRKYSDKGHFLRICNLSNEILNK